MNNIAIEIRTVENDSDYAIAKELFIEYQQFLGVNLSFQSFEDELNNLPAMYGPPTGHLLLAFVNNIPAGCVALRNKQQQVCEMKRLYVPDAYKSLGVGKLLATSIIASAASLGYKKMVLDTLDRLTPAINLYTQLGFKDCAPYYANPLEGVRFMEYML